jgi:hypothetical protein
MVATDTCPCTGLPLPPRGSWSTTLLGLQNAAAQSL